MFFCALVPDGPNMLLVRYPYSDSTAGKLLLCQPLCIYVYIYLRRANSLKDTSTNTGTGNQAGISIGTSMLTAVPPIKLSNPRRVGKDCIASALTWPEPRPSALRRRAFSEHFSRSRPFAHARAPFLVFFSPYVRPWDAHFHLHRRYVLILLLCPTCAQQSRPFAKTGSCERAAREIKDRDTPALPCIPAGHRAYSG